MLASKISCLLVVSLAFLLGTLLVLPSQGQTWAAFKNKHVDNNSQYPPLNPNLYCENQMRFRRMTNPRCKPHNTFINAPDYLVQKICQNIGSPASITSRFSFNLVDCKQTGGSPPYRCNYQGIPQTRRVRVTCENFVPVHFVSIVWETGLPSPKDDHGNLDQEFSSTLLYLFISIISSMLLKGKCILTKLISLNRSGHVVLKPVTLHFQFAWAHSIPFLYKVDS